ncbi:MAG: XrtA/PEP-CTERM system TPR-repeat protein PrsT [Pseudomonadota bacterium]
MKRNALKITLLSGLCGLAMFAASGEAFAVSKKSERLFEQGRENIAEGEVRAGVIRLRNAIKEDPENMPARLLLGQTLLQTGDFAGAAKEIGVALEADPENDGLQVLMSQALFALQRYDEAIGVLTKGGADGQTRRSKALLRAQLNLAVSNIDAAEAEIASVLAEEPVNTQANFLAAQINNQKKNYLKAQANLDTIIQNDLNFAEAWILKAQIALQGRDYAVASESINKAKEIRPDDLSIDFLKAEVFIRDTKYEDAQAVLDELKIKAKEDRRIAYLQTLLYSAQGDFDRADRYLVQVSDTIGDSAPGALLIGLVKFRTDQYAQAQEALQDYLQFDPENAAGVQLLAAVKIRAGDPQGAIEILDRALRKNPDQVAMLELKASAQTRLGDFDGSVETYQKISEIGGGQARGAQSILSVIGVDGSNDAELLNVDPQKEAVIRILDFVRNGQLDEALTEANALVEADPEGQLSLNLLGSVLIVREEEAEARAVLEKALALEPSSVSAMRNLDRLDVRAGELEPIGARMEAALKVDPANETLVLRYAAFLLQSEKADEALAFLEEKADILKTSLGVRGILAQQYAARGDKLRLNDVGRSMMALGGEGDVMALMAAGATYEAAENTVEAINAYEAAVAAEPRDAGALLSLVRVLDQSGRRDEAIQRLRTASESGLATGDANRVLITYLVDAERESEAIAVAERVLSSDRDTGARLRALIYERSGAPEDAIAYLEKMQAETPSSALAESLYVIRRRNGDGDSAVKGLESWTAQNPTDASAKVYLGTEYIQRDDYVEAERTLSAALALMPNNWVLQNNLAWVRYEMGKKTGALELARRAQRQAPFVADVNDTLGWMLVEEGAVEEGLGYLREAGRYAPDNGTIQFHLAYALDKQGQKDEAKVILQRISDKNLEFDKRADADDLLKRLN